MRWLDSIIDSVGMHLGKLWEIVEGRGAWCAEVHGVAKTQTWFSEWTTTKMSQEISSQSEWWWWGFWDVRGSFARRNHQKRVRIRVRVREPNQIKHKEEVWYLWTKASTVIWYLRVKQGLCSATKDSPPDAWKDFTGCLLLDSPSLPYPASVVYFTNISTLWLQLRKLFFLGVHLKLGVLLSLSCLFSVLVNRHYFYMK